MVNRIAFGLLIGVLATGLSGCGDAKKHKSAVEGIRKRRLEDAPTFPSAKWETFLAAWGGDGRLIDEDGIKVLEEKVSDTLVRLTAECQKNGRICAVICEMESPKPLSDDENLKTARTLVARVARGLNLRTDEDFAEQVRFAVFLGAAQHGFSFYHEPAFISVQFAKPMPTAADANSSSSMMAAMASKTKQKTRMPAPAKMKPGSERKTASKSGGSDAAKWHRLRIQVIPVKYAAKNYYQPLPGSSAEQLRELLDGFQEKARIGNTDVVLERRGDDYRQIVHYKTRDGNKICWLESFVCDVPPGSNREKIMMPVWLKLADLKVDGCDPETIRKFLKGEKNTYGGSALRVFGPATWCLIDVGGHLGRLQIWGKVGPGSSRESGVAAQNDKKPTPASRAGSKP